MARRAAMALSTLLLISPAQTPLSISATAPAPAPATAPAYSPIYSRDGKFLLPEKYREWIYLSSGIDMSYSPKGADSNMNMGGSTFDNIFVNPDAYKAFVNTGTWPDRTVLLMEKRGAQSKGSINRQGHFQNTDIDGLEVHVKDEARFPGKWAFFSFSNPVSGDLVPFTADCYSCHQQHAAVDTTFVQFYPTLLDIAKRKNTLSADYLKESAASK